MKSSTTAVIIGLVGANFLYQFTGDSDWLKAMDQTFHQLLAISFYWFLSVRKGE